MESSLGYIESSIGYRKSGTEENYLLRTILRT